MTLSMISFLSFKSHEMFSKLIALSIEISNSSHKAFINDYRQFEQHISLDTEYVYVLDIRLQSFGERLTFFHSCCNVTHVFISEVSYA